MNFGTHTAAGVLCAEFVCCKAGYPMISGPALFILCCSELGSLLPDIDHPGSSVSRTNTASRAAGAGTNFVFGHRGPVHSLLALVLMTVAFFALLKSLPLMNFQTIEDAPKLIVNMVAAFALGGLSHLVLDTLNHKGIMWLWPLSPKRFSINLLSTGGFGEALFCALLSGIAILAFARNAFPAGSVLQRAVSQYLVFSSSNP